LLLAVQLIGTFFTGQLEKNLKENFDDTISSRMELLTYNIELVYNNDRSEGDEGQTRESEVAEIVTDLSTDDLTNVIVVNSQSRIIGTNSNAVQIGQRMARDIVQQVLSFGMSKDGKFVNQDTDEHVYVRV